MACNSPSGERHPNDIRTFLSGPGLRILLGVGAGYVARRLWTHPQDVVDSKLAQLRAAPTITMSALKGRAHNLDDTRDGQLVLIQDSVVQPLSYLPTAERRENDGLIYTSSGHRAVLKSTEVYYTGEADANNKGTRAREEFVSRVPFALVPDTILFRKDFFVVVKNAGADQLPLRYEAAPWTTQLGPKAHKVTQNSVLLAGTPLESVFGRLRKRDDGGFLEIEPCLDFPKKCFTMNRREIKREIRALGANADVYPIRTCSVGVGLVSLGLIFSGIYSYSVS